MRSLKKILKDEKGTSVIMVAVAIVVVFGFAVVAIDMSLIQLAKTQLQNAADAGALAGAVAIAMTSGSQADKEAAATAEAISVCALNVALQDIDRSVLITAADVTFPDTNLVRCSTGRGDMVTTYFLKVLGSPNETEMTATATAGAKGICGTDCLRPFCPPDRWDDRDGDGEWDDEEPYDDLNGNESYDTGEPFTDENGDSVWTAVEFYDAAITGFRAPDDVGDTVTLKLMSPSDDWGVFWYYAVDFGPLNTGDPVHTGADAYRTWICEECEPYIVSIGDLLQVEPGNMVGPTVQGLRCLIDKDPDAIWNDETEAVESPLYGAKSPRIIKAPAFDPTLGLREDFSGRKYLTVSKILVLFVEENLGGGDIFGRFIKTITEGVPGDCSGSFMTTVVLVE